MNETYSITHSPTHPPTPTHPPPHLHSGPHSHPHPHPHSHLTSTPSSQSAGKADLTECWEGQIPQSPGRPGLTESWEARSHSVLGSRISQSAGSRAGSAQPGAVPAQPSQAGLAWPRARGFREVGGHARKIHFPNT